MDTKHTLSTTEARKKLFQITKEVQTPGTIYTFTENGKPKAVMMSAEEFESWQETLEVMQDFPNLKEELKIAEEEIARGETVEFFPKDMLVAEKKGKYVSARVHKKRSKAKR
jgi:prevent-host-death family protein